MYFLGLLLFHGATACRSPSPFVWASALPPSAQPAEPIREPLRRGDTLAILVDAHEALNVTPVVTSDGFIVLPLVGALQVEGKTAQRVTSELTALLKRTIENPRVSVVVVARRIEVNVMGEVRQPGKYVLDSRDGVVSALALAEGLTEFASAKSIYVIRSSYPLRIRFRMKDLVRGGNSATSFRLRDGDIVVVE